MSSFGQLPPQIIDARERLDDGRLRLKAQHDSGSPGLQVCVLQTSLVDAVLHDLYEFALEEAGLKGHEDSFCLIGHGGYGRRDVAPYSDVDLMLLHTHQTTEKAAELARILSQAIVDAGCQLGFSLRTARQACQLAWSDATIFTSLVESRLVDGCHELFEDFMHGFRRGAMRRSQRLLRDVVAARKEERRKYGETVFLLEPNIKRSRGSLRDIQLVRWIGFALHGECDLEVLAQLGHLSPEDHQALKAGYRFLLRIRNQMHFDASKSQDQVDRMLQIRLAEWAGYAGAEGILPVEQFMQEYFKHTSEIRYSSTNFIASATWNSPIVRFFSRLLSIPSNRDFRIGLRTVWATQSGLERCKRDPAAVLELMSISSRTNRPIAHQTWQEIRSAMLKRTIREIDQLTISRFAELMQSTRGLAQQLRRLHELRVLEQIIPAMTHARCLLQFNQYHKYTVDAHSIQAVECVTELENDTSPLGDIYRDLKDKSLLHLSLLIHDLGKGFGEDHSIVGERIANTTADRLRLGSQDKETLAFLVRQHLLLAHTAFRFDLSNNEAVVKFASVVGSTERLQLLLLLTYADLASVGPDVVHQWKIDLLLQLYYQTDSHFRDEKPGEGFQKELEKRRNEILAGIPNDDDESWWRENVAALPVGYLLQSNPHRAIAEIHKLKQLKDQPSIVWAREIPEQQAIEFTVALRQADQPVGTFHRITGALTSQEMQIIAADVNTQPGNIAWDRFLVEDLQCEGSTPTARIEDVCNKISEAIKHREYQYYVPPTFPKKWSKFSDAATNQMKTQPTQVRFDNNTSDAHTIITVFAYDRMGLLFAVAKVLSQLSLVLHSAKISTHLDQVVDVFYVTDVDGNKITESTRLYMIRQKLLQAAVQTASQ